MFRRRQFQSWAAPGACGVQLRGSLPLLINAQQKGRNPPGHRMMLLTGYSWAQKSAAPALGAREVQYVAQRSNIAGTCDE